MTLLELRDALTALLDNKPDAHDETVCLEAGGLQYTVKSVSVVVAADVWIPETVLIAVEEIDDD